MSDSDEKPSADPGHRPTGETERANHALREKLQDGTDESILDTEGKPAEAYAEQEDSYSRDPDTLASRKGTT